MAIDTKDYIFNTGFTYKGIPYGWYKDVQKKKIERKNEILTKLEKRKWKRQ